MPHTPQPYVAIEHPQWWKNAAICSVNIRRFTPEGTFAGAMADLPRVRYLELGVFWLMPVRPIEPKMPPTPLEPNASTTRTSSGRIVHRKRQFAVAGRVRNPLYYRLTVIHVAQQ